MKISILQYKKKLEYYSNKSIDRSKTKESFMISISILDAIII